MIQIYAKGTTDFSKNGIRLHPQESTVTFQDKGQFDFEMVVPADEGYTDFDYGQIIESTVPEQDLDAVTLGDVSYYTVTNANGTNLLSSVPVTSGISYTAWTLAVYYAVGTNVTYNGNNYTCTNAHYSQPQNAPGSGDVWQSIPNTQTTGGASILTLEYGDELMMTADFNTNYIEAATLNGKVGYVKKADITATGETDTRVVPARTITAQRFLVTEIKKEQQGKTIRVTAEHISYQLGRTILGQCSVTNVTPATALLFIGGAMKESYSGNLYTNMTEPMITADWSWKNAQSAVMDPKAGLLAVSGARMIRDNLDVFILAESQDTPKYSVRYGANMKDVRWTGNVDSMVTRIYPTGQTEDGSTLLLPEEYIDTVRTVPFIRPEVLNTGLKVGQKVKNSDGTETELTQDEVLTRMRTAAQNRFSIDKCDLAEVSLELDWQHMPDTVEYAQYSDLKNAAPGDLVEVVNGPLGISAVIRMTGYTWDPENEVYKGATFGDIKTRPTVAGYNLKNGSVGSSALAYNSVSGANLQADTITAREIEAGSITADKIAARSITTELLMAEAITANEISANAITTEKLAAGSITTVKLAAQSITSEKIAANAITAGLVAADAIMADNIQAGAVTAAKIAAAAVTTEKLDAYAVTAAKIAAGAIEADKIAADAITADKISASDLTAINAKLGTASIASAVVQNADINYAHVKDLDAQSAYFGQAVIQEGLANKLYIPRLAANYAQIVNATISDLVIQATDDNFYKLDVDLSGNVTATQVTPSAQEIADGHTADGRTIYLGTDIVAADLNTMNIYASHALMDEITANIINVDKLFAREATIAVINATDLSSNTYIRSTIGNWSSSSTITQTVDGLNSRISSLGYGTVYMQPDEPNHSDLVTGDIWIQTLADTTWQEIYNNSTDFPTWQAIYQGVSTWQTLGAIPVMWVWDGRKFQKMYDALIPVTVETEIQQLATAITLRATKTEVDQLSDEITELNAQLTIQADEIEAAVSTVNAKAASFVMWEDPRTVYTVSVGDIWVKRDPDFCNNSTWQSVYEDIATWQALNNKYDSWANALGDRTYIWNGFEWVETSDRATEIYHKTLIDQTSTQITLLAEASALISDDLYQTRAELTVTNNSILQEVQRATAAEGGKIDKTGVYQTADAIVSEAVRIAGVEAAGENGYIAKTSVYQTADSIVSEAVAIAASEASGENGYIKKTRQIQTADALISEAVRQAGVEADGEYIAQTSIYQSADEIVAAAEGYSDDHFYAIKSGIAIKADGIEISGGKYIKIKSGATFTVDSGNFSIDSSGNVIMQGTVRAKAGYLNSWKIEGDYLWSGSGANTVVLDSSTSRNYAIYAGTDYADMAAYQAAGSPAGKTYNAPFRVKRDGTLTITKLMALNQNGTETEVNLRTIGLWKLGYETVKPLTIQTDSGGYCTSFQLSNGTTVNFRTAAAFVMTGAWSGRTFTVSNNQNSQTVPTTLTTQGSTGSVSSPDLTLSDFYQHKAHVLINGSQSSGTHTALKILVDATSEYESVEVSGIERQSGSTFSTNKKTVYFNVRGVAENGNVGSWTEVSADVSESYEAGKDSVYVSGAERQSGNTFSDNKKTVYFNIRGIASNGDTGDWTQVSADVSTSYTAGENSVTATAGEWSGGVNTVTLTNGNTCDVSMPAVASWTESWVSSTVTVYCTVGGKTYSHTVDT